MTTPSLRLSGNRKIPQTILSQLSTDLQSGAVVIFPTETVYGIGTSVFSRSGIRRIYELKGRHGRKPLALLVHSLSAARPLVETIPPEAERLANRFWPGPLTLVFKASPLGRLVTGGLSTIGVRIPDHPVALAILQKVGIPLATTSVNRSGQKPTISGIAAAKLFGSRVDWMIDGGTCRIQAASSVIDLSHYPFTVIRDGAISKKILEKALYV
jgi:L-threonylcarbamoyladenylate synthase